MRYSYILPGSAQILIKQQMSSKVTLQKGNAIIIDERYHQQIALFIKLSYSIEQIDDLSQLLFGEDIVGIHHAIIGLRKIISCDKPPVDLYMKANIIPRIVELAGQRQYPHVQHEAVWILTNIASCQTRYVRVIVELGVIQIFVDLLKSDNDELVDEAVWGLGNICGDSSQFRDKVIQYGLTAIYQCLRSAFQQKKLNIIFKNACWALGNIIRVHPLPPYSTVKESCLLFIDILQRYAINDEDALQQFLWSISYSCVEKEISTRIIQSSLLQMLVNRLQTKQKRTLVAVLAVFTKLIQGNTANFRIIFSKLPIFLHNLMEIQQKYHQNSIQKKLSNLFQIISFKDELNIEILIGFEPFYRLQENGQFIKVFNNIIKYGNDSSVQAFLSRMDMYQIIMINIQDTDQEDIVPVLQCIELILGMHYSQKQGGAATDCLNNLLENREDLFEQLEEILLWEGQKIANSILRIQQMFEKITSEE